MPSILKAEKRATDSKAPILKIDGPLMDQMATDRSSAQKAGGQYAENFAYFGQNPRSTLYLVAALRQ